MKLYLTPWSGKRTSGSWKNAIFGFYFMLCVFNAVSAIITWRVLEESKPGTFVGNLGKHTANFRNYYLIISSKNLVYDKTTGNVNTKQAIDRDVFISNPCLNGTELETIQFSSTKSEDEDINVKVLLDDINDNWPQFTSDLFTKVIPEEAGKGFKVQIPTAKDKDCGTNGTLQYKILNTDNFMVKLSASQDALDIVTVKRLDRELKEFHILNIEACDHGIPPRCNSTILNITVSDFNDNKPIFHNLKSEVQVEEKCNAGSKFILALNVSDKDSGKNGQFTLSVSDTPDYSGLFDITINHDLVSTKCLTYDKNKPYINIVINAKDHGVPVQRNDVSLRIVVVDINDNTPVLFEHLISLVHENRPVVPYVGIIGASDSDGGENANVSLKIISGNPYNQFYLEKLPNSGLFLLKLKGTLDREKIAAYNITVEGSDHGIPPRASFLNIIIPVLDVNDNRPICSFPKDTISLPESSPVGSFVTIVQGLDKDEGKNSELKYSIADGSNSAMFNIIDTSGLITTTALLDYEMETLIKLQVNVEDNGDTKLSSFCLLTINVTDINDNKPVFTNTTFIFHVHENVVISSVVANLFAFDADAGKNSELMFNMLFPSHVVEETFYIDRNTGAIQTLIALDRENHDFYQFMVLVQDNGDPTLSSVATVELTVLDINDNQPVFYPTEYYVNVHSNQSNEFIVNVTAVDVDKNDAVLYEIINKNPSNTMFNVNQSTGTVTYAGKYQLDINDVFTMNLTATDYQGHVSNVSMVYITIITPEDDLPQFEMDLYSFNIEENVQHRSYIGKVKATTKSSSVDILYSIYSGDPEGMFSINKRGEIRTLGDVDHEKESLFNIQVMARTSGRRVLIAWTSVVIVVEDVNDNPPEFEYPLKLVTVKSTAPIGSIVYKARALDPDSGNGGIVKYEMLHDSIQVFSILDSGDILVATDLSHTLNTLPVISIIASDFGLPQLSSVLNLTINIIKENSQPPVIHKNYGVIPLLRNVPVNQVFFNITASDLDDDNRAKVYFHLFGSGNATHFFGIFPEGSLYVKHSLFLTSQSDFALQVIATDRRQPKLNSTALIHISVLNMQHHQEIFRKDIFKFGVYENENSGTVVGKLDFVTKFQNIKVDLVEESAYFTFDHVTNEIKTKQDIDREQFILTAGSNNYVLYAKASRKNDLGLHAVDLSTIVVKVNDRNDNVPVFSQSKYVVDLEESVKVGTVILKLITFDKDEDNNAKVNYSIVSSSLPDAVIVESDGDVILNKQLEKRHISYVNFSVQVMNIAPPHFSSTCFIEVNIHDVNNNVPQFAESSITRSVSENFVLGQEIYRANASDGDFGRNSRLAYTITSGNQESNFEIDRESGKVTLVRELNFEETQSYVLTIFAADSGIAPLSTAQILIVNVTDVNDNYPRFTECPSAPKISEDSRVGFAVIRCLAVDSDTGVNGLVRYSISREKPNDRYFRITNNGTLYVNKPLDREQFSVYKIDIKTEDSAIPETSRLMNTKTITIELEDVNDNSPRFISPPAVHFGEFASKGDYVTTLKAWDPDVGSNGTFTFSKGSGKDAQHFNVDDNGRVTFATTPSGNVLFTLDVIVTDSGTERRKSEQELSVFMYKEGGLSFLQNIYSAKIVENEPVGTFVINVTAVATLEVKDTKVGYFLTNDSSGGLVSLDSTTGVITVKERIDREGKHGHQIDLVIYAVDVNSNTAKSSSVSVHLTILDLNDNVPTFIEYVYTNDISENAKIGSDLIALEARDEDEGRNGSITYEIVSGDNKKVFHINKTTGQISVADNLDHETQSSYTLNVTATDHGGPSLSSWTVVSINILDINDNVPTFQRLNYSFTVVENYPLETVIGRTVARDPDSGENGELRYSLTGDDAHLFTINERSGILRTAFSFDRENIDFYLFKVFVSDKGSPIALSSVVWVYVSILDENDNNPQFNSHQPYTAMVKEDALIGTPVITVNASDKDVGVNSTINYAITKGDNNKSFRISNRGTIFTASGLDRENIAQYNLKITISDSAAIPSQRRTSTIMIIVNVADVNDHTPYFLSEGVIHIKEDQVLGKPFAIILAQDEDTGLNGKISYELQGYFAKALFQIDQDSGKLSLRQALDREKLATGQINITVEAKDRGQPSKRNQQSIQIIVDDVNDNTPIFQAHLKLLKVYENISIGSEFLRVNAIDKDQGFNGKVEYAISAGNVNDTFYIHPIDGIITLIRPLDRENIDNYEIEITAFDLGSPSRENFTTVRIHVLDVNDNEPQFKHSPSSKSIKENIQSVENLAQFVAVDEDEGENSEIVYSILHSSQTPFLRINNASGIISLVASLDREVQSSYSVIIEASDNGSPALHTQTQFTILVEDVNDNSPMFVNPDLKPSILEGSPSGSQLCVMNATDADSGVNADISYELVNDFGRFQIDPKTGKIFTIAELDREIDGTEFKLTVKARDKGNPALVTCATVIGRIEDINDNRAEFESKTYSAYIPVRAPSGTFVTVVSAFDKDEGLNAKVIYKLKGSSREFLVESDSGHVLTIRSISSSTTYSIKVQAINAKTNLIQDTATVNITTTTKHFPSFDIPVTVYNVSEDEKPRYFLVNVKATDDPSLNIESGDPDEQFSLDIVSRNLTLNKKLDYETKRQYNLWLRASLNTIYSTYINIQVYVVDSNDNIPVFEQSRYDAFVIENDGTNVSVICIIAEDNDSGALGFVEYRILEASALNWFRIDRYTGCIYTARSIDREQNFSFGFTVQARDHGLPPNTNNVSVRVNILDSNDNPPILNKHSPVYIFEDESPRLLVTTVFANDQDDTSNLLYLLKPEGNYKNTFDINSITGEVFLTKKLDREIVGRYPLTVSATDGKFSDTTPLTIIIEDVDDNPPTFPKSFYSVQFKELQPVGSVVMKLNISDKDLSQNSRVVYFFKRTPTSQLFRIDSSGIITSVTQFRFVKPTRGNGITNRYNLTVYGYNSNHPSAKPTATVTVEVTDANNHYPVFEISENYTYIPSVSKVGTRIIVVHAVDNYDVGLNSEVSYKAVGGNGTILFSVGSTTGHVTVANDISSEQDKLFLLEIQALDRGTPAQVSPTNIKIFIMVTIRNQHPPKFTKKRYSAKLMENYGIGKEFLRVNAADSDSGINGKVTYSIVPGKQGRYFNVDSHTGSLTIANVKLDYEYLKEYSFDIQAEDGAQNPQTDQATVTVTVLDFNDNPPEFQKSSYDVDVVENNQIGSEIVMVTATDRDTIGNTITYTLDGKDKNFFIIDQKSGKVTTNVEFDYESRTKFTLTVLAKDSGDPQKTSDCTVLVNVLGMNEFKPEFIKKTYVFSVPEDAHVGNIIGKVSASDQDNGTNGVVQFILVDPSGRHNSFDIDESTGEIYVCGRLNFETVDLVELTILVKNPLQRILNADNTDKANVTVKIQDSNDPPRFLQDFMKVSVDENIQVGSVLGNFTAVDEDTNKEFVPAFKYTISDGNINKSFILEAFGESVSVKTNKLLDREVMAFFNLTIAASDITGLSSRASLVIEVKDINDNPPFLKRDICPGHVKENLPRGAFVLRFDAIDKDVDPNKDPYTFEITNEEYVPFVIDKFTPELKTFEVLDREKVSLYVLQIKIEDSGYPKMFSTTSCDVIVDDVNDNRPSADTLNVKVNVPATGFLGGVISDVSPLDLDEIKEYSCRLDQGDRKADIFDFQPNSCILNVKIDEPPLQHYFRNVIAHDTIYSVPYSLNISFNAISETTNSSVIILRLSGINSEQFLAVMNKLSCIADKQIYSIQKVNSTVTDVLMAYLQDNMYISRDKLSQILTNCKSTLERALGARIMDTNYNLCSTSNPCNHGKCESRIILLPRNRTSLYSGTEIFVSAYHEATFSCICDSGFTGEYCQYSTKVCEGIECKNSGRCIPTDEGFECQCQANFRGKYCGTAVDLCDPNPCSKSSQCLSTGEGAICQCDFGGRGERCELSSIGFKSLSYMTFPSLSSSNENTKTNISLQIATVERNGLILYNRNGKTNERSHFIALEIVDGLLKYSFDLGNGVIRITSDVLVSDGSWHTVIAVRDEQNGLLHLDTKVFSSNRNDPGNRKLDLGNSPLYIGGVPSLDVLYDDVFSYDYIGCMRDIYLNNIALDVNTALTKYGIANSCPRVPECRQNSCHGASTCIDKWFNTLCQCTNDEYSGPKCNEKVKPLTLSEGSVLRFKFNPSYQRQTEFSARRGQGRRRRSVENLESFSMNVRVRNDDAFLWRAQDEQGNFTQLHTKSGLVHLSLGSSADERRRQLIISNIYVNNGNWFNVSLTRDLSSNDLTLKVNDRQNQTQSKEPYIFLSGTWTFGSINTSDDSISNFQGCLSNIKINGEIVSLNVSNQYGLLSLEKGNFLNGCESPDYCSSSPCPDSTCVNNWHSFSCVASLDGNSTLSIGAIAGIVFFCILVIAIIVAVIAVKKKRTRNEFAARLSGKTNTAIERDNSGSSSSVSLPSRKTPSRHSLTDSGVDIRNRSSSLSHENVNKTNSSSTNVIALGSPDEYTIVTSQHDSVSEDRDNGFTDSESEYGVVNNGTNLTISSIPSRVSNHYNQVHGLPDNQRQPHSNFAPYNNINRGFLPDQYQPSRSTSPSDEPESIEMQKLSNDIEDAEQYSIGNASFATYSDLNDSSYVPSRYSDDCMRYKPSLERCSESDDSADERHLDNLHESFEPTANFESSGESSDGQFTASEYDYEQRADYEDEEGPRGRRMPEEGPRGRRMSSETQIILGRGRAESYGNVSDQYEGEMNVDDPVDLVSINLDDILKRGRNTSRDTYQTLARLRHDDDVEIV